MPLRCQPRGRRTERRLDWDGAFNVRDLVGLPVAGGMLTRSGPAVRSEALDGLAERDRAAVESHGVRTVIDLRNEDERRPDRLPRLAALTTIELPLDDRHDRDFWDAWDSGPQFGAALWLVPHIERRLDRSEEGDHGRRADPVDAGAARRSGRDERRRAGGDEAGRPRADV